MASLLSREGLIRKDADTDTWRHDARADLLLDDLLLEYFAAIDVRQHLAAGGLDADQLWPRDRWCQRSGWEEASVLLAGLYSDDCTPVIRWLKDVGRSPIIPARR